MAKKITRTIATVIATTPNEDVKFFPGVPRNVIQKLMPDAVVETKLVTFTADEEKFLEIATPTAIEGKKINPDGSYVQN